MIGAPSTITMRLLTPGRSRCSAPHQRCRSSASSRRASGQSASEPAAGNESRAGAAGGFISAAPSGESALCFGDLECGRDRARHVRAYHEMMSFEIGDDAFG